MELQEGLEFYRRCLDYAKLSLAELMKDKSISEQRKEVLIDKLLDRMIEFSKENRCDRRVIKVTTTPTLRSGGIKKKNYYGESCKQYQRPEDQGIF